MSENFRDYLLCLAEDSELLKRFKADRRATLRDARISREERDVLRAGDKSGIRTLLKGQPLSPEIERVIDEIAA